MATLKELAEEVIRNNNGSIWTDEQLLDELFVYNIINDARAYVLRQDFIKFKRWSPTALQTFYPDYESYYQNSTCYTRFTLPTGFIQANSAQDGLVYFGSDGVQIYDSQNLDRIKNRAELNDFLNNSRTNDFTIPAVLIEGLVATILSKENMPQNLMVVGALDDPTKVSTFNIDKDQYPLSGDLIEVMHDVIQNGMRKVFMRSADTISDSRTVQQPIR